MGRLYMDCCATLPTDGALSIQTGQKLRRLALEKQIEGPNTMH
jgi:hypothetical protein